MKKFWSVALVGLSWCTGVGGDGDAVRAAFARGKGAFETYRQGDRERERAAQEALVEVFRAGTLDEVHGLLRDGTIGPEMSRRMATVRNGMIEEVREELTRKHREVHVSNFSPAVNLLNDIDETFWASDRLGVLGIEQSGSELKRDFEAIWEERYAINAERMDVVSHTSEAGIPDWRKSSEVHTFVARLRQGSRLLESNPEAYFLEGGFRMQVERRSFASEMELYSVYSYVPRIESGVAKSAVTVQRRDGTIGALGYRGIAPEMRRGYAAGSAIGNWWFLQKHGGGTRYAAKYGLRSFSEGPGFLETWDSSDDGETVMPREYEKLESYRERQAYCDDVYATHFRKSDISRAELWQALETARLIRNAGDGYRPEMAFERRALELVGGDRAAYEANRTDLLARADLEFRGMMTRVMIRNIEVAVPARLGDWLDPHVDPREIGLSEEDIRDRTPHFEEEMTKARKRLRVSALFESIQSLRVLDPALRERVIASALEDLRRRSGTRPGGRYPFERALRAVAKLAGAEARPHLLQLDEERRPPERYRIRDGLVVVIDDAAPIREVPLAEQVGALRADLEAALVESGLGAGRVAVARAANDLTWRWSLALAESEDTLRAHMSLLDPRQRTRTHQVLRATLWNQLGWRAESEWHGIGSLTAAPNVESMTFDGQLLLDNVASLGNAQAVLNLIQAYRRAPDSPEARREAVTGALLAELAGRLPYVGDAIQVADILSGRSDPILGTGLMVATYLYPGVGQVVAVYSVADGTARLLVELGIEGWVAWVYQGAVPNDDGSPGPGRSTNPMWRDVRGVLEPVRDWMLGERERLLELRASAEESERAALDDLLAKRFPADPTVASVRSAVYPYYSRRLLPLLERSGAIPSEFPGIQLQSFGEPDRSRRPADLVDITDLPPLLRAYLRPIVRSYFEGSGDFAKMPTHVAAHAHPLVADAYFYANDEPQRAQEVEHLTRTLAAAYMRFLIARGQGADTRFLIDPRWDQRARVGADAYLHGLPASAFRELERQQPEAGPAPALPGLFDLFGATPAEQDARVLAALDEELNRKIARHAARFGGPEPDRYDDFKLGKHFAALHPVAPEVSDVPHPLLLAFFNQYVHKFLAEEGREKQSDDGLGFGFGPGMDGELALPPLDTSSVGPSETTGGTGSLWHGARLESELAQTDLDRIQAGVVQLLIRDYKHGLLQAIAEEREIRERERVEAQLPAMAALADLDQAVFGVRDAAEDRPAAGELARHELPSPLGPDEEHTRRLEAALRSIPGDAGISIEGVPGSPLALNGTLELACQVEASDLYFERPYRVEWVLEGLDEAAREKTVGASETEIEEQVAFAVGTPVEGIEPRTIVATAIVTDATGLDMGSARASFQIDPLAVEEEDEAVAPAPVAATEPEEGEEEPELPVEEVAYVIRVEGSGWVPHYGNGSYIVSGSNEEVIWVKNGESPQAIIDAYQERLDKPPCEARTPAHPLQHKRPVFWGSGPKVSGVKGPIFDPDEVRALQLESNWTRSKAKGPNMGKLKEMFGCE